MSVLDGVRGVAVGLVLLVHFTPDYPMPNRLLEWVKKGLHTGWIGVDLFFVLSGMLITDILLRTKGSSDTAKIFYARRCLRILPLYLASLTAAFVVLPWFVSSAADPRLASIQSTQIWYWAHCANLVVLFFGFPAMMSETVNLAHLWSLSVEEHFYLIWPLLVWSVPTRRLLWVAVTIILGAFGFRMGVRLAVDVDEMRGLFVQTPMRMDGLAVGSVLAILFRQVPARRLRIAAMVILPCCGGLLLGEFFIRKGLWSTAPFVTTVGLTIIAVFFASWIVLLRTSAPRSWFVRTVDNPPFRFLGRYSYGIYVLHGLLTPTLDRCFPSSGAREFFGSTLVAMVALIAVKAICSIVAALISWHVLEAPCLRLKRLFEYDASPRS